MCGVELWVWVPGGGWEELGLSDVVSVLWRSKLRWYGHVLQTVDNDWVKKCTENEVRVPDQEVDQRKLGQRLWKKTVRHVN